jgi:hypothetical protein
LQSRGLLRWHPIKALLIRKRFHSSSKGTAASLGESQDRRDTQVDAAAGEGGGLSLPFAARAPPRPSFPVGAFAGACSIADLAAFSGFVVAHNRSVRNQRKIYGALGGAFHTRLATTRGSRRRWKRKRQPTVHSLRENANNRRRRGWHRPSGGFNFGAKYAGAVECLTRDRDALLPSTASRPSTGITCEQRTPPKACSPRSGTGRCAPKARSRRTPPSSWSSS